MGKEKKKKGDEGGERETEAGCEGGEAGFEGGGGRVRKESAKEGQEKRLKCVID